MDIYINKYENNLLFKLCMSDEYTILLYTA